MLQAQVHRPFLAPVPDEISSRSITVDLTTPAIRTGAGRQRKTTNILAKCMQLRDIDLDGRKHAIGALIALQQTPPDIEIQTFELPGETQARLRLWWRRPHPHATANQFQSAFAPVSPQYRPDILPKTSANLPLLPGKARIQPKRQRRPR